MKRIPASVLLFFATQFPAAAQNRNEIINDSARFNACFSASRPEIAENLCLFFTGRFNYAFSYGAVDLIAKGTYTLSHDTVYLNSLAAPSFKLSAVQNPSIAADKIRLKFKNIDRNESYILFAADTAQNIHALDQTADKTRYSYLITRPKSGRLFLQHKLYDKSATAYELDKSKNEFTITISDSLGMIAFNHAGLVWNLNDLQSVDDNSKLFKNESLSQALTYQDIPKEKGRPEISETEFNDLNQKQTQLFRERQQKAMMAEAEKARLKDVATQSGKSPQTDTAHSLNDLQAKYNSGMIDSGQLLQLIWLTKSYNRLHTKSRIEPDEFELLDSYLKNRDSLQVDPALNRLVAAVYADGDNNSMVKRKISICSLIRNYKWNLDTSLVQYNLISNSLAELYTETLSTNYHNGLDAEQASNNSSSIIPSSGSQVFSQEQILQWNIRFLKRLENVPLLNEGMKLLQRYYERLQNRSVYVDYIEKQVMPLNNWYFDTVLKLDRGLPALEEGLQALQQKLTDKEEQDVDKDYGEFENFKASFMKDLGSMLNDMSWEIFKKDLGNKWLPKLLLWSKLSLQLDPSNPYYLDTYAQLLYVSGGHQPAIEKEKAAIEGLKLQKNYSELKGLQAFMEKALASMKAGKKLERKDYQQ